MGLTFMVFAMNVAAACICGSWMIKDYTQDGKINAIALTLSLLNAICAVYNFLVLLGF